MTSIMRLSLSAAVPTRQLACLRGCGLAALRHSSRLQRRAAPGAVRQQAPKAAAGSSSDSTGQAGSEAEGQEEVDSLAPQPNDQKQQQQQEQWQQAYSQVLAFQQAHGRLPGTDASKTGRLLEGERELGMWCVLQQRRKDGSKGAPLSAEEKAALQAIPGWEWVRPRPTRKDWWRWLQEVEAFVAQHERLPRRQSSKSLPLQPGEKELGVWCVNQRTCYKGQRYKGQEQSSLSHEQEAALAAIPGWFWQQYKKLDWEQQYQHVVAFQQQHGRLPRQKGSSSQPLVENEQQLGQWCHRQRLQYKSEQQPLSPGQEAALAAIPGWYWEQYKKLDWEQQRQQVLAFQQQYGRLPRQTGSSSQPVVENEGQLGQWCTRQRRRRFGGFAGQKPLTPSQVAALESIEGWWWNISESRHA